MASFLNLPWLKSEYFSRKKKNVTLKAKRVKLVKFIDFHAAKSFDVLSFPQT